MQHYIAKNRLSDLVAHNPLLLMAMSRFGISLGFADKTVEEICAEQGVDCPTFLAVANYISFGIKDIEHISLSSLMTYLDNAHKYFLDFCLPMIRRKLIEAIDCSGTDEITMLILRFYDEYVEEVRRHMAYESKEVFDYVRKLLRENRGEQYNIEIFASHHHSIHDKLEELKDILIRYLPQRDSNLLNVVLFDIINCEQDLMAHCKVEDDLFVPVVRNLENSIETVEDTEPGDFEPEDRGESLSRRERDIIACVAMGLSNKEIADKLFISVNTVTTHRRNLAKKLQIHSPAGLTIYAVINGIVDIKDLARQI